MNITLTKKQREAWTLLQDSTTTEVLFGGSAGGGKSRLGVTWLLLSALQFPNTRYALCRKNITKLKQSTLITLLQVAKDLGVLDLLKVNNVANTVFVNYGTPEQSEILLLNLEKKPRDPEFTGLGSLEFTYGFIDEVSEIDKIAYEVLKSRIGRWKLENTNTNIGKLLMTCNPSNNWVREEFHKKYIDNNLPDDVKYIPCLVTDNPFIPPSYVKRLEGLSHKLREQLLKGNWYADNVEDMLFDFDKIEDIFTGLDYSSAGQSKYYISIDPSAGVGKDRTSVVTWEGMKIIDINIFDNKNLNEQSIFIRKIQEKYKIPRNQVITDNDGLSHGLQQMLESKGVNNNSKPFKKENYQNLKTQLAFKASKEKWSIDKRVLEKQYKNESIKDIVRRELGAVRDNSDEYKFRINSKDEMKKLLNGKSPDILDSIIYRFYFCYLNTNINIDFS